MPNNYLAVANEAGMWLVASLMVGLVLLQSFIFVRKAFTVGRQMGLTSQQLKAGFRAGAITAVGPSVAILIGMVALIALIGAPIAWMRLSVIGAVMFETLSAQFGAEAMGVRIGEAGYGLVEYANSLWVMALGAVGWLLVVAFSTHKLDDLRKMVVRGREELLPIISIGAILGAFGFQISKNLVKIGPATTASLVGGCAVVLINLVATKTGAKWLKEWSLGLAMLAGMFAAVI